MSAKEIVWDLGLCGLWSNRFRRSTLANKDLAGFHVLEPGTSDHRHDRESDSSLVIKSAEKLLEQFRVGDSGAYSDSTADGILDACDDESELLWGVLGLVGHA